MGINFHLAFILFMKFENGREIVLAPSLPIAMM